MNTAVTKQQILIFEKSRNNLLLVIAFTVINLVLIYFNASVNFLFSATVPKVILLICKEFNADMESSIFIIVALIIAFLTVLPYFIFWILAKRVRVLILVTLIFFSIDTLILLYFVFNMEFDFSVLMEIPFHAWILYYLFTGVKAWNKLRGVSTEVYNTLLQEIKSVNILQTNPNAPSISNNETNESNNPASEENSPAKEDNNFYYDEKKPENK